MDLEAARMPLIPSRTHRQIRHHHPHAHHRQLTIIPSSSSDSRPASSQHMGIPPASPEVIANLITSLSALPSPTQSHFDSRLTSTSLSLPTSPIAHQSQSFGVDFGVYSPISLPSHHIDDGDDSLDEVTTPVIAYVSHEWSGHSSPRIRSSSRDSIGPRSYIRNSKTTSRPSSRASIASKNEDARSIGNLSIERGPAAPALDLKPRSSIDSWCKKTSRGSRCLSDTNSKEGLRDTYKKRYSGGIMSSISLGSASHGGKADAFFAENPQLGESLTPTDSLATDGPRLIPLRDSSLRRTNASRKLSSARRSKRNTSEGKISEAVREAICESPDSFPTRELSKMHRRVNSDVGKTFLYDVDEDSPTTNKASSLFQASVLVRDETSYSEDDGAPFPSVSQGRRRDDPVLERNGSRLSGRISPGPNELTQPKRSSSRLKRLSAGLSSPVERRNSSDEPGRMPSGYERPKSADSVDDAVESYLCSPRLSRKIRHPQTGRVICFSEVGDPEGSAVFCCVGMGLTRYITAFYDELALTLKLRLITPDRPGVGGSEVYADGTATPLGWPDDVYAICQALKITKFSILAHSAGAIYALATALRMPQHIRGRIHLLAPWIPPSQMNVFGTSQAQPPSNTLPTAQRILRALPTPILRAANSSFMSATSASLTSSLPKNPRRAKRKSTPHVRDSTAVVNHNVTPTSDKENTTNGKNANRVSYGDGLVELGTPEKMDKMQQPDGSTGGESPDSPTDLESDKERQQMYDLRLTHAIWELATTNANPAVDLLVCLERQHTIGFRYVDITRPVVIHHGSKDNRVPVENVKWLGRTMRRCEVRVLEQEGHGLMASAMVMGSVLMEISKEWEDWIRATGADDRRERNDGR